MSVTNVLQYQTQLQTASNTYGVPLNILDAVADHESGGNPNAISPTNPNGSTDYGLLQISSPNFPSLGVNATTILDPQTNANAGASILAQDYNLTGSWASALSMYNTGSPGSSVGANYASAVLAAANTTYANPAALSSGVAGTATVPTGTGTSVTPPATSGAATASPTAASSGFFSFLTSWLPTGPGLIIAGVGMGFVLIGAIAGMTGGHPLDVALSLPGRAARGAKGAAGAALAA